MLAKKIIGPSCYLSPYDSHYAPKFFQWVNDLEVTKTMLLFSKAISLAEETKIMEELGKEHAYMIVDSRNDEVIGGCGLFEINHLNGTAEAGILIGDKSQWGKGYGTEALRLLCGYGFDFLNLGNIMLQVYEFNQRGMRAYEKVGFKEMGRRRSALRQGGRLYDIVFMDLRPQDLQRAT